MSDSPTPHRTTCRLCAIVGAIGITLTACSTSAPRQTKFMQGEDVTVSAEELRIQVRALAVPFSGIMEEAADDFIGDIDEPIWIEKALLWKINGIPAMQRALYAQDPLAALLDAWVLLAQMRDYFEAGAGSEDGRLGRLYALEAIDRMDEQIEQLARSISATGNIEEGRKFVKELAGGSHVDETFSTRPSSAAQLAKFTAEARPGIGSAVGALTTSLGDVWSRMDVYSAYLPKQARWQAELMVLEVAGGRDPGEVFDQFGTITDSIDRIAATVEQTPGFVSEERTAILVALQAERVIALQTLSDELEAAYEFISRERVAAFTEDLAEERRVVLEALTNERIATMKAIHEERVATMAEFRQTVGGLSEDALTRLVDRIFVQLLVLIVVVGAMAAVAGFLIVRRPRNRR